MIKTHKLCTGGAVVVQFHLFTLTDRDSLTRKWWKNELAAYMSQLCHLSPNNKTWPVLVLQGRWGGGGGGGGGLMTLSLTPELCPSHHPESYLCYGLGGLDDSEPHAGVSFLPPWALPVLWGGAWWQWTWCLCVIFTTLGLTCAMGWGLMTVSLTPVCHFHHPGPYLCYGGLMTSSLTPECQCPSHHPKPHLCYGGLDDIEPDTWAVGVTLLQGQHHHLTLLRH